MIFLILGKKFTCLLAGHPLLLFGSFSVVQFEIFNICLLVLLVWSFAKLELRGIFYVLFFIVLGKNFTCLLAGHPPFIFWSFWCGPMRNLLTFWSMSL